MIKKKSTHSDLVNSKKEKKNNKSFEENLWSACNKLRGSVEPAEYKHIVLSLIFLKFVSDLFEEQKKKIIKKHGKKYIDLVEFYTKDNVFYLSKNSTWEYILKNSKQNDISIIIDSALKDIEKKNNVLEGALPDNYFSRIDLENTKLSSLLDKINNIQTIKNQHEDIVGRVYEYFLGKFAIAEGKGKGEYYTPKSIVNLICELIKPYKGKIYDPCCGSGGMFVQSMKFIENHKGNRKNISIYGQEQTATTFKLAKMNLAIRGITANLGAAARDTFKRDQHVNEKFDFIMANPPFNQKEWREANELTEDSRWNGYTIPPTGNANYGWILHMVSKLSKNGVACFVLANGSLSADDAEFEIRKQLIENKLVEAIIILPREMFYTTDISVTLWVINKDKKINDKFELRKREDEILFMDLRQKGIPFEKKYTQFSNDNINEFCNTFHVWRSKKYKKDYKDIAEYCYSAEIKEIREKNYTLVPSQYIEFINRDEDIDFDKKIKSLNNELADLIKSESESKKEILKLFKELGYEIKL